MPRKGILAIWLTILLAMTARSAAQLEQNLPTIVRFTSDRSGLSLAEVEAGNQQVTLRWTVLNLSEGYIVQLYAYEIATWVLLNPPNTPALKADDSFEVIVRHPLNFNPPSYRLMVTDENLQVYSEAVLTLPYTDRPNATRPPTLNTFTVTPTSLTADEIAYRGRTLEVTWAVENRTPTSNLAFVQIQPDGEVLSVELSRRNLWITSSGMGIVRPVLPTEGNEIDLRLRLLDVISGDVLDELSARVTVTGTLSTPTPAPVRPTAPPAENNPPAPPPNNPPPVANVPPPVVNAGAGGGFEIGGHIASFGSTDVVRAAGMTWVKKQIRWRRGDGTGTAASLINSARASGFKILLGIVGYKEDLADFEAYTNEFAAYLGQVAALGPEAIEVWNEPNIDREWLAGTISGANYTVMLAKAFNAIKAVNGNVMVVSGAPAPTGFFGGGCATGGCDDNVFLRQMANAGAAQYMDCVGAHYNEGIISPDLSSGDPRGGHYSRYFPAMLNLYYNTFGGARPVCWTELGFLTPEGYPPLPGAFAWAQNTTLAQHAEWLGRAASLSRGSGRVRLMIVWNVDFQVYDNDPQAGYAIRRADGSCPACASLSAAMQ